MSVTSSQWVVGNKVALLHELVKQYDGRTVNWPTYINTNKNYYLTCQFDSGYGEFSEAWERLNTPIKETYRKHTLWRTLKNFLSKLFWADTLA